MSRALFLLAITASGTCGQRPDPFGVDIPHPDAGEDDGGIPAADCTPCTAWDQVEVMGPLPSALDELSGLVASRAMPGVLYTHNDSGDVPRFFALSFFGQELAELRLVGAEAIDWEDIALGPCTADGVTCVFLGDIGDNLKQRTSYTVYRVREPDLRALVSSSNLTEPLDLQVQYEALPFVYPGSMRHNAETLLAHPRTGDLYVITKETTGTQSEVFKFPRPFTPGQQVTLIDLGPLGLPAVGDSPLTGGDIHPCGDALLLRLYNRNVELRAAPDAGFETAFSAAPNEVPTAIDEPQGEAIAWGSDGQSYFTASEHTAQMLHRVRCLPRAP
jgi:hypothetical protein